jgi:hypothetical protein
MLLKGLTRKVGIRTQTLKIVVRTNNSTGIWYIPYSLNYNFGIQSNLSYVTFQGNSEIGSHKTGGHLIQVYLI